METLYSVLGIDKSATEEEIKQAYYRKATEHHPDRGGDAEVMATVNRAATVLLNTELRKKYDDELGMLAELCPKCSGAGCTYKQKGFSARTKAVCQMCNGNGVLKWKSKPPSGSSIALGGTIHNPKKRKK